jgi:hypothetical protein
MPHLPTWTWILGALCAFFVGIAKTGVPGLGVLVVPMMVLAVGDAKQSSGWLLPILCTADIFAVLYWRRHAAAKALFSLLPSVAVGIALGAVALRFDEKTIRVIVGAIIFVMLAIYLRRRLRPDTFPAPVHPAPYGVSAGFSTTVANAAGPVMNLYLLSKQLPKEEFVATGAWFFFIINLTKIPIYAYHGMISRTSLTFDALMIPAVLAGSLAGRWLVYRIPQKQFEWLVIALTIVSTLLLFK